MENGELIEIITRRRVKGGWGEFVHSKVTVSQVGAHIRYKWGKSIEQIYKETKIGEIIMVNFYGTMTQIAACYKAAGDDIYRKWCNMENGNTINSQEVRNG